MVAPGVGLEPARPRRATGSQAHVLRLKACALIHSAFGMARHSGYYPGVWSRPRRLAHLVRSVLKCLPIQCLSILYVYSEKESSRRIFFSKRGYSTKGQWSSLILFNVQTHLVSAIYL